MAQWGEVQCMWIQGFDRLLRFIPKVWHCCRLYRKEEEAKRMLESCWGSPHTPFSADTALNKGMGQRWLFCVQEERGGMESHRACGFGPMKLG